MLGIIPDYSYACYTCHFWLDDTLREFLPVQSHILQFQSMYTLRHKQESFDALNYLFGQGTCPEDLPNREKRTRLQKAVAAHVAAGGRLYTAYGTRRK